MYNEWIVAYEAGDISAVVMIDMSAAFDVVDISILLDKLKIYGFQDCSINWLSSYLTNRKQQVFIDGNLSEPLDLEAGVPQGSILGPLLYTLFTNDLPEVIHNHADEANEVNEAIFQMNCKECGGICCYADDTTFTKSAKDPLIVKKEIEVKYKELSEYMSNNKLCINSDKTHLLVMTSSKMHKIHGNFGITLNTGTEIIEPQDHEYLLGGIISSNFKWIEHIRDHKKSMLNQITSRLNALNKISRISSFKTRKVIADGIIMSKFSYLIQLYGGTSEFLINLLQKLQNKAARLVTKLDWYTPVPVLMNQCGWLSIRQLIVYHSLVLVFKTKNNTKPEYLHNKLFPDYSQKTRLTSSNGIRLRPGKKKQTELGNQNFVPSASMLWNNLPPKIRQLESIGKFKIDLKIWIKTNVSIQ